MDAGVCLPTEQDLGGQGKVPKKIIPEPLFFTSREHPQNLLKQLLLELKRNKPAHLRISL